MRTTLLGLAVWFALILYISLLGASTLDGCNRIGSHIVCEPGAQVMVFPT